MPRPWLLHAAPLGTALLLTGCGSPGEQGGGGGAGGNDDACLAPNRIVGDQCLAPGVQDDGCLAGEVGLDDGTCLPIDLPTEDCPPGQMAVPGEMACHPVMDCGTGRWGTIPVDAATVYVDAAYAGASSDGSEQQPYTTISSAVAAASPGALIAVAAGSYEEDVSITKPVRLWGVCPDLVQIVGQGNAVGPLLILSGASGTEVVGLAATTDASPLTVGVSGAEDVILERLWIHDASGRGVNVEDALGPTSLTLRHTLVEKNRELGLFVATSAVALDGTVIRDTLPAQGSFNGGVGMSVQGNPATGDPATVMVSASLIERNQDAGVLVAGSSATIEGTVVRDTLPRQSDQGSGRGINAQPNPATGTPAIVTVSTSRVERNHEVGVYVSGSTATIEGTVVRDTLPQQSDLSSGRGINVQADPDTAAPSTVTLATSLFERNHDLGVYVSGSAATIGGVVARDTLPRQSDQTRGRGIGVQADLFTAAPATATISASLVERNHDVGIIVAGAAATIEGTVVRDTMPRVSDALFGDGIAVFSVLAPASGVVSGSVSEANARAGLSSFGADVSVGGLRLMCNAIDLAGEPHAETPFSFNDLGDNLCGCEQDSSPCKAISAGLAPPEPIDDTP